jgi:hypothetical protein
VLDSVAPCAGALKAYDKAIELHRRTMQAGLLTNGVGTADGAAAQEPPAGPPVRLLNNAAVLHLRYGDLAAALPLMEQAVEARCLPVLSPKSPLHSSSTLHQPP